MKRKDNNELIDQLRSEWSCEAPNLDTSAMDIVGRVIHLANIWTLELNERIKLDGLKYTEFDIIATLRRSGKPYELTPTQLCESVLLTSGAMTTALNRVERLGLIYRIASKEDKRVKTARLTPKGIKLALNVAEKRFELARQQIQSLTETETLTLSALLSKCR